MNHSKRIFLGRFFALFIALTLALPSPSFALRPQAKQEQKGAGLEELQVALRDPKDPVRAVAAAIARPIANALNLSAPADPVLPVLVGLEEDDDSREEPLDEPFEEVDLHSPYLHFVSLANEILQNIGFAQGPGSPVSFGFRLKDETQIQVTYVMTDLDNPEDLTGVVYREEFGNPKITLTLLLDGREIESTQHSIEDETGWSDTLQGFAGRIRQYLNRKAQVAPLPEFSQVLPQMRELRIAWANRLGVDLGEDLAGLEEDRQVSPYSSNVPGARSAFIDPEEDDRRVPGSPLPGQSPYSSNVPGAKSAFIDPEEDDRRVPGSPPVVISSPEYARDGQRSASQATPVPAGSPYSSNVPGAKTAFMDESDVQPFSGSSIPRGSPYTGSPYSSNVPGAKVAFIDSDGDSAGLEERGVVYERMASAMTDFRRQGDLQFQPAVSSRVGVVADLSDGLEEAVAALYLPLGSTVLVNTSLMSKAVQLTGRTPEERKLNVFYIEDDRQLSAQLNRAIGLFQGVDAVRVLSTRSASQVNAAVDVGGRNIGVEVRADLGLAELMANVGAVWNEGLRNFLNRVSQSEDYSQFL